MNLSFLPHVAYHLLHINHNIHYDSTTYICSLLQLCIRNDSMFVYMRQLYNMYLNLFNEFWIILSISCSVLILTTSEIRYDTDNQFSICCQTMCIAWDFVCAIRWNCIDNSKYCDNSFGNSCIQAFSRMTGKIFMKGWFLLEAYFRHHIFIVEKWVCIILI